MSGAVKEILDQIQQLPESERLELCSELARREEREWAHLSAEARRVALERGIDDEAVTRAVESTRYGDSPTK